MSHEFDELYEKAKQKAEYEHEVIVKTKGMIQALWEADELGLIPKCCLTKEGRVPDDFEPLVLPLKEGEIRVSGVQTQFGEKCLLVDIGNSKEIGQGDDIQAYPDGVFVTHYADSGEMKRIGSLRSADFDWEKMSEEQLAAAVILRKKMFPNTRDILTERWEQLQVVVMRTLSRLPGKAEKVIETEEPIEAEKPVENESRRLAIEQYNLERQQLELREIRFAAEQAARKLEEVERKIAVAGAVGTWQRVLQEKGLEEGLPVVWTLANRTMQQVGQEQEFVLPGYGKVGLGKYVENGQTGIQAKIWCDPWAMGDLRDFNEEADPELYWIVNLDKRGEVTYFSPGWRATKAAGQVLAEIKFTGERLPQPEMSIPVDLRQRSEQVSAELVR